MKNNLVPSFKDGVSSVRSLVARANDRDPLAYEFDPHRDWRILMSLFIVAIIASGALGFFLLTQIGSGQIFSGEKDEVLVKTINKKLLVLTLADYKKKEDRFEELLRKHTALVDPSL